jgi:hypothetical protein
MEAEMFDKRTIVVTAYGHDRKIDKIAVSIFDEPDYGNHNAETYCKTINSLESKDNAWVSAKVVWANAPHFLDSLLPPKLSEIIQKLDDRSLQKVLMKINFTELAKALKNEGDAVQYKVFKNLSTRTSKMLKEDMEYMELLQFSDIKEAQDKIISIILHLAKTGEIINPMPDV